MPTRTRSALAEELMILKSGVEKNLAGYTVEVAGVVYTQADVVACIDGMLDAQTGVAKARGHLKDALAKERSVHAAGEEILEAVRSIVRIRFKNALPRLAEFGLSPRKARRKPTAEEKLVIGAKIRATRKERGTLGKRRRKAVRGDVTGVVITPVTVGEPTKEG